MSHDFDITKVLDIAFSEEQLTAITAPLCPGVIIAGAGSGKTTVMAARVVWLVGTGQVRPNEVLGLTFTRKAAAELSHRVRNALIHAGFSELLDHDGEPDVMTYDAFAGALVTEHGVRIGLEPGRRLLTDAGRFQAASAVVHAARGPLPRLSRLSPAAIAEKVLGLAAQMNSHLVTPAQVEAELNRHDEALEAAPLFRQAVYKAVADALVCNAERRELLSLVRAYEEHKQRYGLVEFADTMAAAARLAREVPYVGQSL
ncbi:MAG: UvrD-helicase domain-containing protein, partial [Propionibacteriaceae bacterium]